MFRIKRIYDAETADDGLRVLVDRIWPRGISKKRADLLEWEKNVAPSTELRKWFNHETSKFKEFAEKYKTELNNDSEKVEAVKHLKELEKNNKTVTLLYSAKNEEMNQAVVLKDYLESI